MLKATFLKHRVSARGTVHCLCLYKILISRSWSLRHLVVAFEPRESLLFPWAGSQSSYLTLGASTYYTL